MVVSFLERFEINWVAVESNNFPQPYEFTVLKYHRGPATMLEVSNGNNNDYWPCQKLLDLGFLEG